MSNQDEILELTRLLRIKCSQIAKNEQFVDDDKDLDFHIRAIQNIIYTQKYNSQTVTFEIKGSDLIGIIENNIQKNKDRI